MQDDCLQAQHPHCHALGGVPAAAPNQRPDSQRGSTGKGEETTCKQQQSFNMKSARPYRSHKYPACTRCHKRRSRCTIETPGSACLLCRSKHNSSVQVRIPTDNRQCTKCHAPRNPQRKMIDQLLEWALYIVLSSQMLAISIICPMWLGPSSRGTPKSWRVT